MARIRTIKPEFTTSEQIVSCSRDARLLFITMWMFCDDGGVHPHRAKSLKMQCFPGDDDVTPEHIETWLAELIAAGLLGRYEVDGKAYLRVTGWHHQKVEKPNFKYPRPPVAPSDTRAEPPKAPPKKEKENPPVSEHSTTDRRPIDDRSPPESSLEEGKGVESKGDAQARARDPAPPAPPRMLPLMVPIKKSGGGLSRASPARASRASGPNLADKGVRKSVWESRVIEHLTQTRPPAETEAILTAYMAGTPDGKRAFEAASAEMRRAEAETERRKKLVAA